MTASYAHPHPEPPASRLDEADPWLIAETDREHADRDAEWWDDDPTAYDLPMTGATHLRPGERRDLA